MAPPSQSIQNRLLKAMLLTSLVALVLACASFVVYEVITFRQEMAAQMSARSQVLAANCTASLAFLNVSDAEEVLSALSADRNITAAALYDLEGRIFAKFPAGLSDGDLPAKPGSTGPQFAQDHLMIFTPVTQNGRLLGTFFLKSSLRAMQERFRLYGIIVVLVLAASLLVTWLISTGLLRQISKPILSLAESVRLVSETEDYSVRAQRFLDDELGQLADGFNTMLARVQSKDAALRENEQRLRELADAMPQIVWTARPDGSLDYYNQRWFDYTGLTFEETQGWGWKSVLHPDDLQRCIDRWTESISTGSPYHIEYRFKRALDGVYRWHLGRAVAVRGKDGRIARWFGSCTDIDDQKRAAAEIQLLNDELEKRVHERTAQLEAANAALSSERALIEAIRKAQAEFITAESPSRIFDGLLKSLLKLAESEYGFIDELFYDSEGKPYLIARAITDISWNDETRRMYAQFVSGELRFTNPNSLFGEVMTTGKPVIANDAPSDPRRAGTPPGHPALKAFLGIPLYSGNDFVGVIGLANRPGGYSEEILGHLQPMVAASANLLAAWRNDQRRKEAEKELRRLNSELARRTTDLETANRELEAFSYSVSHDLRAPLRHIDGYVQLLVSRAGDQLGEKNGRYLHIIAESAKVMGQLIDDLLVFSRIGRGELRRMDVDLGLLCRETIRVLEPDTVTRPIQWRVRELPVVPGDAALLRQVFLNLLGNAIKYTRGRTPAEIEIGSDPGNPDEVVVYVRDNGVGFDMKYSDKLFGVFQRLHASEDFEGTGIGLANVNRIITRHGGRCWAEGKVDEGATFYFSLPNPKSA